MGPDSRHTRLSQNMNSLTPKSKEVADDYNKYITAGFSPLPYPIERTKGSKIYDVDGKEYIDLAAMFSVVNFGHNHPKIVKAAQDAMGTASMVNTGIMSVSYARFAKKLSEAFGYDKFVALTSGAEATDAAVKIARKWGYVTKKIPAGESLVVTTADCYHGLTISTHALSTPRMPVFGPYNAGVGPVLPDGSTVRFGVIEDLEKAFEKFGDRIAGFMVEPILGSAGIILPPDGYLTQCSDLCKKHNVLFIADEVQTGFGRTGYNLASFKENLKPDLVCLGKAIGGGIFPLSGVIGDNAVMNIMAPGEFGSTMAATPPATEAAIAALEVLFDEDLSSKALHMEQVFKDRLKALNPPHVAAIDGQGLYLAIALDSSVKGRRVSGILAKKGVICRSTEGGRLRVCPPLVITEEELLKAIDIINETLIEYDSITGPIPWEDNTYFS